MPHSRLSRWQRALAVFTPPLVALVFAYVLFGTIERRSDTTARVQRTHQVIAELRQLRTRLVDAETGQRGYLLTGDSLYLEPFTGAAAQVDSLLGLLGTRLAGDVAQQGALANLTVLVGQRLQVLTTRANIRGSLGFDAARDALIAGGGRELMDDVRGLLRQLEARENERLAAYHAAQARADRIVLIVLLSGVLLMVVIALVTARLFVRDNRALRALNRDVRQANSHLQDQALELEMQTQELQAQSAHLEDLTLELEASNDELQRTIQLAEARSQEAEAANRAKTEFLAAMSHELRTPLNAITGYTDLLSMGLHGPINETQVASLERVRYNAQHLLVLINDILNFAKVQAGGIELRPAQLPVAGVLVETANLVRPLIDAKRIRLECEPLAPSTGVVGDPDRVRQILFNLLTNAVKYTDEGGRVSVWADVDGERVHIRVRDTGTGIPPEMQERIFDPFVQLRRGAGGGLSDGVGLGLAISRELARAMRGELSVASVPGAGSTFTLTLTRTDGVQTVVLAS